MRSKSVKLRLTRVLILRIQLRRFARMGRDRKGVAAVEFALILPFMLLLYLGTAELTYGLMANRKMTLVARTLADLTAQTNTTTGITDAEITDIFTAAAAIMSPYDASPLRMSISSIEFFKNPTSSSTFNKARTKWTAIYRDGGVSKGTARPCGDSAITQVANSASPSSTTMPVGLYGAGGTVIVADVSYLYRPPFAGSVLAWSDTQGSINFAHTAYMRPRTQDAIAYNSSSPPTGRTKCP